MPPDWTTLSRLLVICLDDRPLIDPAMQVLQRSLPQADVTVLTPSGLPALDDLQKGFEAAIVFTASGKSPYAITYLCYLAGIPIRIGQSIEFGGGVLSHWVKPPLEPTDPTQIHLHLLASVGFSIEPERSHPRTHHETVTNSHLAHSR